MLRLPAEWFLALRYLRPKRTFVSVITLISVVGVMLGVAVLIIVISVMTGFDQQLRDKILGFSAHLKILRDDGEAVGNYEAVERRVQSHPQVKAVAPFILGQVMVKTQPASGKPKVGAPFLRGIDLEQERHVTSLATSLISGELAIEGDDLLVGSELAHHLRLSVGDRVAIYSPRNLEERQDFLRRAACIEKETAEFFDRATTAGLGDIRGHRYRCPDKLVPPPRGRMGRLYLAANLTVARTSCLCLGMTTPMGSI